MKKRYFFHRPPPNLAVVAFTADNESASRAGRNNSICYLIKLV